MAEGRADGGIGLAGIWNQIGMGFARVHGRRSHAATGTRKKGRMGGKGDQGRVSVRMCRSSRFQFFSPGRIIVVDGVIGVAQRELLLECPYSQVCRCSDFFPIYHGRIGTRRSGLGELFHVWKQGNSGSRCRCADAESVGERTVG